VITLRHGDCIQLTPDQPDPVTSASRTPSRALAAPAPR
jgi:hypothetical protein